MHNYSHGRVGFASDILSSEGHQIEVGGISFDHGPIQMVSKLELRLFFKPPINLTVFNHFEIKDHITKHNLPIFNNFKF